MVRRQVGQVSNANPAPGPPWDLTKAFAGSDIRGKSCVSRWARSTRDAASCCHLVVRAQTPQAEWVEAVRRPRQLSTLVVRNPSHHQAIALRQLLPGGKASQDVLQVVPTTALQRWDAWRGSLGGNLPNLPNELQPLNAKHCGANPPRHNGSVEASATTSEHWWRSNWRMFRKHCHKPASCALANSSTKDGLRVLK